ncbi:MAG: hypothetical protein GF350_09335, partial [Chitinivibrionales bacterium]|nr:hypothetical protein [Chitinivibrionales bacterium]
LSLREKQKIISSLVTMLKAGEDLLPEKVRGLMDDVKQHQAEIARLQQESASDSVDALIKDAQENGKSFPWAVKNLGAMDKGAFGNLADAISDRIRDEGLEDYAFVIGVRAGEKALFAACAGKKTVSNFGIHCGNLVKSAAKEAGGGGGGSPLRAQAGGKMPDKIDDALQAASLLLQKADGS